MRMNCHAQKRYFTFSVAYFLLALLITGCGPVYETQYSYRKPPTQEGIACTFQCENLHLQCTHNKELRQQNCETNNRIMQLEYEQCVANKGEDKCSRDSNSCEIDLDSCKDTYNRCYTSCGGSVSSRVICVEDCDG